MTRIATCPWTTGTVFIVALYAPPLLISSNAFVFAIATEDRKIGAVERLRRLVRAFGHEVVGREEQVDLRVRLLHVEGCLVATRDVPAARLRRNDFHPGCPLDPITEPADAFGRVVAGQTLDEANVGLSLHQLHSVLTHLLVGPALAVTDDTHGSAPGMPSGPG